MIFSNLPTFDGDLNDLLVALENASRVKPEERELEWLGAVNAPPEDLFPTLLSFRACLLGMKTGKSFFHHELRKRISMTEDLEPPVKVWEYGTVPVWQNGVLEEPKYFSFFQEAPLASYNPCHRTKWRAHELLHGAISYFWRPDLSRFEAYLSARLNELLPVVHWYSLDEIFRHRCHAHDFVPNKKIDRHSVQRLAIKDLCVACEREKRPFWEVEIDDMKRQQAKFLLENAIAHFEEEYAVCAEEIERGIPIETPRGRINASSDAIGYMESHWNRMTAWSFGSWMERFMAKGIDYFDTIEALYKNVDVVFQNLLGGDISLSKDEFIARRNRRIAQDVAYRGYLTLEWLDPESKEGVEAEQIMEQLFVSCEAILSSREIPDDFWASLSEIHQRIAPLLPPEVATAFPSVGVYEQPPTRESLFYVMEGLSTALPALFEASDEIPVEGFVESDEFRHNGLLAVRFCQYLQASLKMLDDQREIAKFEGWAIDWPHKDDNGELFAALPDREIFEALLRQPKKVVLKNIRKNNTLRHAKFNGLYLEKILGEREDILDLFAYFWKGELRIIEANESIDKLMKKLDMEDFNFSCEEIDQILELIVEGMILFFPSLSTK